MGEAAAAPMVPRGTVTTGPKTDAFPLMVKSWVEDRERLNKGVAAASPTF